MHRQQHITEVNEIALSGWPKNSTRWRQVALFAKKPSTCSASNRKGCGCDITLYCLSAIVHAEVIRTKMFDLVFILIRIAGEQDYAPEIMRIGGGYWIVDITVCGAAQEGGLVAGTKGRRGRSKGRTMD